jgi:hypothetical protein
MSLSPRRQAFQVGDVHRGLDHQRTQWSVALGDWVANSTATFMSGQLVCLNAAGEVILATGATKVLGVAKESKATAFVAVQADERIQLNALVATNLKHPNVWEPVGGGAGGVTVALQVSGGTPYTEGGGADYVVNYVNGTVVRAAGSTIADGAFVYVTYRYTVTDAEMLRTGSSFWNKDNEVSMQNDKITVIEGPAKIWTAHYDTSAVYAVNAAVYTSPVAGKLGVVTSNAGGGALIIGRVIQPPTASDPFLGYELYAQSI